MIDIQFYERRDRYVSVHRPGVNIKNLLGDGTDGAVWSTSQATAIKVFGADRGYRNELDAYLRLQEYGVTERLAGFWIPEIQGHDDELMVIEMDLMQKAPYIIDFAKVRFYPPDFSDEVLELAEQDGRWRFGSNWPVVKKLLADLESFQIYYLDPKPQNIAFSAPRS